MARLFISYPRLDEWIEQGRASVAENRLTVDGKLYTLSPGVYFLTVVGGDADPNELLGRVKTQAQLAEISAEHYQDSVLVGEVGYQVLEGIVGEPDRA